jgi:hypothetical protein
MFRSLLEVLLLFKDTKPREGLFQLVRSCDHTFFERIAGAFPCAQSALQRDGGHSLSIFFIASDFECYSIKVFRDRYHIIHIANLKVTLSSLTR